MHGYPCPPALAELFEHPAAGDRRTYQERSDLRTRSGMRRRAAPRLLPACEVHT